ncbi:hypothetical protein DOTSEDRAFT_172696 [Dothistroma septosporum NZE10]|uniref:Dystroglycan-type cadherin-like domain-containing protein n=1 Tax=Dothistroma septosporum (strain NZE10 / CBS 128990) TaxID=675120 RepID=N1PPX0_DOTSN|nr:hypothetical protein DOTSEDRAFT_172696 [Dothistroma septosporum NZE10]
MAIPAARALNWSLCIFAAWIVVVRAIPNAAFPFNSQVPTVARVNEPYSFQFSHSTFAPTSASYVYSLSNQPVWLLVDSATRTLSGTPGQADAGSITFSLTAADGTGASHMDCTLVVSSEAAPQPPRDIGRQLAATANLSSSDPPIATLLPSTNFNFNFQQESFIDIVQRKLWYYATLADHTPLPSWLKFDSKTLTFTGTAPDLSAFPQSWTIELIASDIEGFTGASASFTIAIGTQQLAFVPEAQELNITAGQQLSSSALQSTLFRNNELVKVHELKSAVATDLPPWLSFDAKTLELRGTVPERVGAGNISISVTDPLNNTAVVLVNLAPSAEPDLFDQQIGTLVAQAGEEFSYHFGDSIFSNQNVSLSVAFPPSATWLTYDSASNTISGHVPSTVESNAVQVTLQASSTDDVQFQTFTVRLVGGRATTTSSTTIDEPRDVEKDADSAVAMPATSRKLGPPPQITLDLPIRTDESPNRRSKWSKRISRVTMSVFGAASKRKTIRMVQRSDSTVDTRPLEDRRQSYIRHRASAVRNRVSTNVESPLFAHGSRVGSSNHSRQNGSRSANGSLSGSVRQCRRRSRSKKSKSMLSTYSESSSLEPQGGDSRRFATKEQRRLSERLRSSFAPTFPRVMSRLSVTASNAAAGQDDDWTTSESTSSNGNWKSNPEPSHSRLDRISMNSDDWRAELAKPRNERCFVVPGEASPTPPPAFPASRQKAASRDNTPTLARPPAQRRISEKSPSPLSSHVLLASPAGPRTSATKRRSRLTDPAALVSADSMSNAKVPRPGIVATRRPVSIEEVQRLSSMKAETDAATTAGSERDWEDADDRRGMVRVMPFGNGTAASGRSDVSGPAFL